MTMRRIPLLLAFLAPIALVATSFVALVRAAPSAQPGTEASGCVPDLRKWVEPESILLGETATVSLLVSGTCPTRYVPVDLIIVADESNSMTPKQGGAIEPTQPVKPTEPNPDTPPPPPTEPGPISTPPEGTPGNDPRGSEPPFCNPGGLIPVEPTFPKPPDPVTPDPSAPPPTKEPPGGHIPPGTRPAVEPPPDIESLEPSGATDWVREEKSWIRDFLGQPEIERDIANGRLRIGFVSFNERARVRQPLTDNPSKITSASNRMRGGEVTWVQQGIRAAEQMLDGSGSREDVERVQVMVILSDFQFCRKDVRPASRDIEVMTVGFGVRNFDRRNQFDLATEQRFVFEHRDLRGLVDIYEDVVAKGSAVDVAELKVHDELNDRLVLVPGSVQPPTVTVSGQLLEWSFADPTLPMTLSYGVEPLEPGTHPVSIDAGIDWTDSETLVGSSTFPTVTIEVVAPTPTATHTPTITPSPTATDTPTPTYTPTPAPRYLPVAYKQKPPPTVTPEPSPTKCVPWAQTVDVGIVIDTSTSMNDPTQQGGIRKIDAAIDAAIGLVELLKDNDQTTIVWFNNTAGVASQLTTDKAQAIQALRGLTDTSSPGTALHLGILAATEELTSPRHNPASNTSLVLLTDGRQSHPDGVQAVRDAADQAKQAGITIVTVGLGTDVDADLLTDVATEPELYFPAPNAEDLEEIYILIADLIPCR